LGSITNLQLTVFFDRFPADSQAILDRIDRLERTLLQANHPASNNQHCSIASNPAVPGPVTTPKTTVDFFTVENVLSWPVFRGKYEACLGLRGLMTEVGILNNLSPQSIGAGKGSNLANLELDSYTRLLDNFFTRIHIKNPVLDEKQVRRWTREIAFNGIGWDARSCLVVCHISAF
jgi:hypothetical protein